MILVDPGSLEQDGLELNALLAELGVELTEDLPVDTPRRGWRVLACQNESTTTIGAPADAEGQWWRLGIIVRPPGESTTPSVRLHPSSQRRRPSREDRAGGLVLRWPDVTRSSPNLELLAIDVVNAGTERWHPQGDSFMVFAALRQRGGPDLGVGFAYVAGQNPAMPLDPGEYARVRVVIDSGQWADVRPGPYEIHAILVDLGLHGADPLQVDLTEQDIRDHAPRKPKQGPPAG